MSPPLPVNVPPSRLKTIGVRIVFGSGSHSMALPPWLAQAAADARPTDAMQRHTLLPDGARLAAAGSGDRDTRAVARSFGAKVPLLVDPWTLHATILEASLPLRQRATRTAARRRGRLGGSDDDDDDDDDGDDDGGGGGGERDGGFGLLSAPGALHGALPMGYVRVRVHTPCDREETVPSFPSFFRRGGWSLL